MSFWERIVGSSEDSTMGSILARLTSVTDTQEAERGSTQPAASGEGAVPAHATVAFTIAVVALGAKMAKADGHVTPDEVAAFKQVFTVARQDMANVGRVFDLARQDIAGYEEYADQLGRLFQDNKPLLQDVLEGLFHVATADAVLHPAEDQFLAEVARRFGFSVSELEYIRAHFIDGDGADPFHVLSLTPAASDAQVRTQYRKLVLENHPDRYMARGLPREAVEIADRKLAAINAAYGVIAGERGLK
jgi:DnaJ like chaperone protein